MVRNCWLDVPHRDFVRLSRTPPRRSRSREEEDIRGQPPHQPSSSTLACSSWPPVHARHGLPPPPATRQLRFSSRTLQPRSWSPSQPPAVARSPTKKRVVPPRALILRTQYEDLADVRPRSGTRGEAPLLPYAGRARLADLANELSVKPSRI